jgi:hypothetical protein
MPNSNTGKVSSTSGALTVTAYPGDNMVLIAMSLADLALNDQAKIWLASQFSGRQPASQRNLC